MIAFHRWSSGGEKDDTIVIMNFSNTGRNGYRIGMPRDGQWKVRFNSDWSGYDSSYANWGTFDTNASYASPYDGLSASALIDIGPYTCVILSQGNPPPTTNSCDVNGDGTVDASDLATLLGLWGSADAAADVNDDGTVNAADLAALLGQWGWQSS